MAAAKVFLRLNMFSKLKTISSMRYVCTLFYLAALYELQRNARNSKKILAQMPFSTWIIKA
jgi:hypothetical protein